MLLRFAFMGFLFHFSTSIYSYELTDFQLIARANLVDGYNLPAGSDFSNSSPFINNRGDVSIRLGSIQGQLTYGLWVKNHNEKKGAIVYQAPKQRLISDPFINELGDIVFSQFDHGVSDGVFLYNSQSKHIEHIINPKDFPLSSDFSAPAIDNHKRVHFRRLHQSGHRDLIVSDGNLSGETLLREGHGPSYIFNPHLSLNGQYRVVKVRKGEIFDYREELPDYIKRFNQQGQKTIIAKDHDADSESPFLSFDNSPRVASNGDVVFIAKVSESKRAIFHYQNGEIHKIAQEGREVHSLEFFAPAVNANGYIVFRAINHQGQRVIYSYRNDQLSAIISQGDYLVTDRETARVLDKEGFPSFSAGISLNDHNQLLFHVVLESKHGERMMGSAIYQIELE